MQPTPTQLYRPADLRALTQPPRTAAEVCAEAGPLVSAEARHAECVRVLTAACPDADPADIHEAAKTLTWYRLPAAMEDAFTPYRARAVLRAYANAIMAHAAPEKAVA